MSSGVFGKKEEAGANSADAKKADPAKNKDGSEVKTDAAAKKETKPEEKSEICMMKRGDYMIHIYIEQAKDLKVDAEDTVDPIVQINCLDVRKFTTAQEGINNTGIAIWNEHIFFEPKNQEEQDLKEGKIIVKLLDKGFFKDGIIGYYEFDLSYIYQMPDHSLMHKWIVMSNPESENYGEVTGLLKLSITICGQGDEQVGIQDDPHPEREDVIQPPQINPKYYQLRFRFFTAQNIVPLDGNEGVGSLLGKQKKTDAYVKLEYKSTKLKTSVQICPENGQCKWNQEFLVPAQVPIIGGRLIFKVYDEDDINDEIIGALHFEIKDIIEGKTPEFDWKNIVGSPTEPKQYSGKYTDKMNVSPEIASWWKGRILVQCIAEETTEPQLLVKKIDPADITKAEEFLKLRDFNIQIYFSGALALPFDNKQYQVSVRIAEREWLSGIPAKETCKAKYNRFNIRPTDGVDIKGKPNNILTVPYVSIQDIGNVFMYLLHEGERISFWKGNLMDFTDPNPELRWIELEPDQSVGKVTEHFKAGIIGLRMSIHDAQTGPIDWSKHSQWSKKIEKRPSLVKIRVFCWQAKDLPAADESGASDPFIRLTDSDKTQETQVIFDNVNPIFYQGLEILQECCSREIKIEELPPVIVDLYDKDENLFGKDSEDFLARALIKLTDVKFSDGDAVPRPSWYPLFYKKGGPESGQVLLSFAVVADDYNFKKNLKNLKLYKEVKTNKYGVEMQILGLRGLQSAGVLPVQKAFIQFNLKSMVPPDLGANLQNIRTEPKMAGTDPTLNTLIEFNAPLPEDDLFCPKMSCSVFDSVVMGFSQPLIGTFTIPIGQLMHDLQHERSIETEALEQVVNNVKKLSQSQYIVDAVKIRVKIAQEEIEEERIELEKVRVTEDFKKKLSIKIKQGQQAIGSSVINDEDVDEPLLGGDYDEELRQSQRLIQQEKNTQDGPNARINKLMVDSILEKASQRNGSVSSRLNQSILKQDNGLESKKIFDPKAKRELLMKQAEESERAKRDVLQKRGEAEQGDKDTSNIRWPEYKNDVVLSVDREVNKPCPELFIGLGWDADKDTKRKHYRRFYPDELENITEIMGDKQSPFESYTITKGQTRGAKVSFWAQLTNQVKTDASGQVSNEKFAGKFKAVIEVEGKEAKKEYLERKQELIDELIDYLKKLAKHLKIADFDLDLTKLETMEGRLEMKRDLEQLGVDSHQIVKSLADIESNVILKRMLLRSEKMIVRVYMIEGFDLASRDIGSDSDPYLIIRCGNKIYNERESYQLDEPNPKFYKHYDFESLFPGCPMLFIDAYDYDDLFGDDLIGQTQIDLEDRYFLPEWRALCHKPVEYRQIYHPSSLVSQGQFKLWLEINKVNVTPEHQEPVYDISAKPPEEIQLRLCVFDTKDIKMMDFEGTSDVYIRAFFDSRKDALETDTHYRCQTGNASFNYRLVYKMEHPRRDYRLTVQAYDRDFFKSNDIIGNAIFDLRQPFDDVSLTKRPLQVNKRYFNDYLRKAGDKDMEWHDEESFWLPMSQKNDKGVLENNGYVRVRIDIVPGEYAAKNPVGSAREDPNIEPYLPPPVGRMTWSINPCTMYKQLIGPAARRKICIWLCCAVCIVLFVLIAYYVVPVVIGNLISSGITKI